MCFLADRVVKIPRRVTNRYDVAKSMRWKQTWPITFAGGVVPNIQTRRTIPPDARYVRTTENMWDGKGSSGLPSKR